MALHWCTRLCYKAPSSCVTVKADTILQYVSFPSDEKIHIYTFFAIKTLTRLYLDLNADSHSTQSRLYSEINPDFYPDLNPDLNPDSVPTSIVTQTRSHFRLYSDLNTTNDKVFCSPNALRWLYRL